MKWSQLFTVSYGLTLYEPAMYPNGPPDHQVRTICAIIPPFTLNDVYQRIKNMEWKPSQNTD